MKGDVTFRDVEVRTWPERPDLLIVDGAGAAVLAQYLQFEEDDPFARSGDLFDPSASFEDRARSAIRAIENDQPFLQSHFDTDESVCLRLDRTGRGRLETLLGEYGLKLSDTDLRALGQTEQRLRQMPAEDLYRLLCDWHDLVDRRYPAGSSVADPGSWVHRARPDDCHHFHYLAGDDPAEAERLFEQLINVGLRDFSFGMLIRYVYFSQAEFPAMERFPLRALNEAGVEQEMPAGS